MDGFQTAGTLGILYAEDFSRHPPPEARPAAKPTAPPPLTQADVDAACIGAVARAQLAWDQAAAARQSQTLDAMRAAIDALQVEAAAEAERVADGIARVALSAVSAALPQLCQTHGDAEVRVLLGHLLPLLARRAQVVVRIHAGLIDAIQADMQAFDETLSERIVLRAANLPPGDVRLSWEDGGMNRDGAAIRAAIQDGLTQLGLLPEPVENQRSPSLAQ